MTDKEVDFKDSLKERDLQTVFNLIPDDTGRLRILCGELDCNLQHLESRLGVRIKNRGATFMISGTDKDSHLACKVLKALYEKAAIVSYLSNDQIEEHCWRLGNEKSLMGTQVASAQKKKSGQDLKGSTASRMVSARTLSQERFLDAIEKSTVTVAAGPAGTGKTYLAVATGLRALESGQVERLILCRPLVEAGEKMGFLPGDLIDKMDPYLKPLYDALFQLAGARRLLKLRADGLIEVAPLALMRGLSFNKSFVILDEAQNCSIAQMKMFLTRLGHGSKLVVNGDPSQVDLPKNIQSGLGHALHHLKDLKGISICRFGQSDTVRHPLVEQIIKAYEADEADVKETSAKTTENKDTQDALP